MSKKTNEAKRKAAMKKPRRNAPRRKGKRPNPAYGVDLAGELVPLGAPPPGRMLEDPILFRHLCGFILRSLELYSPHSLTGFGNFAPSTFIVPEGVTSTVNPDTPDDKKPE